MRVEVRRATRDDLDVVLELRECVEHDCRLRCAERSFLETELPNEIARRLYERHGYIEDSSIWMSKELS